MNIDNIKININLNKTMVYAIYICIFVIPIDYLNQYFLRIDQYIFFLISFVFLFNMIITLKKIRLRDLTLFIITGYFIVIKKNISYLHLLTLVTLDYMVMLYQYNIKNLILNKKIILISLIFTGVYSCVYFGIDNRFIHTSIKEINQSSLAIILLFLIIRKNNKIIGNILLTLGFLTLSKSYVLGVIVFFTINALKRFINIKLLANFKLLMIMSIILMLILSCIFGYLYENQLIVEYANGVNRFVVLNDFSNFFRFKTNTNLIKMYINETNKLLSGIEEDEFFELNSKLSSLDNQRYKKIKPHNYFFSYLRIYGIFSIYIFWFVSTIFYKISSKDNVAVFLVIFSYAVFLGMSLTSYWLYLSVFTMIVYKNKFTIIYDILKKRLINKQLLNLLERNI